MENSDILLDIIKAYIDKNSEKLKIFITQGHCRIENKKLIVEKNILTAREKLYEYWDQQQYLRKILLNSIYGVTLTPIMRFADQRIGQSTTLNGRNITKHMTAKINEVVTGEYDPVGPVVIYGDTDSVSADSLIRTNTGTHTIEDFFNQSRIKWQDGEKEYSCDENLQVLSYDKDYAKFGAFDFIYRHKVKKRKFKITDSTGKSVIVTEDHSVMVLDNNDILIERKPYELQPNDRVVTIDGD